MTASDPPATGWPLEQLDETLIRERLARARFARLGLVDGDQPVVVPVNIATDADQRVVFRTAGTGLLGGLDGRKVAIEIDGHDPGRRTGWSIVVLGVARDITNAADAVAVHLRAAPVDCWVPGDADRVFAVLPTSITGRVIPLGDDGDWFPAAPWS